MLKTDSPGKPRLSDWQRKDLLYTLSPLDYLLSLRGAIAPHQWQRDFLASPARSKIVNGARQSGKSSIVSLLPCHTAKYFPGTHSLVIADTKKQAYYDMEKVKAFMAGDPEYGARVRTSDDLIRLPNGSDIMVLPASDAARGPSAPRVIVMDEASRIPDSVFTGVVAPMETGNPRLTLVLISTPNGKEGFFHDVFGSPDWESYEVRSPWDVDSLEFRLVEAEPEAAYKARMAGRGIKAYYSPRHADYRIQSRILRRAGVMDYRQELCCEFIEPSDNVFGYEDIERLMGGSGDEIMKAEIGESDGAEGLII